MQRACVWMLTMAGLAAGARAAEPAAKTEGKGDPRAAALMKQASETRYNWSPEVSSIAGKFAWTLDGKSGDGAFSGDLRKRSVEVSVSDAAMKTQLDHHVRSLIMHRTPPAAGRPAKTYEYVIVVEDEDRGPLIMPLGDSMQSTYRVKDGKLVQVNRFMHGNRFTIDVKRFETAPDGRNYTVDFTVTTWEPEAGKRVSKSTTTTEGLLTADGQLFPKGEKIVTEKDGKTSTLEIRYSDIKFGTAATGK